MVNLIKKKELEILKNELKIRKLELEISKYLDFECFFPIDGYDYSKHLKFLGDGDVTGVVLGVDVVLGGDGGGVPPLQKAISHYYGHSIFYLSSLLNSIGSPPTA